MPGAPPVASTLDSPTCTTYSQLVNMPGAIRWTVPSAQHVASLSMCQVTPCSQRLGQFHLHNIQPAQVNTPGDPQWTVPPAQHTTSSSQHARLPPVDSALDSPTCTTYGPDPNPWTVPFAQHSHLVNMPGDPRWTVPPAQHTANLSTCQVTPSSQHLGQSHLHNTRPAQVKMPGDPWWTVPHAQHTTSSSQHAR